jgi:hypothetical protein
MTPYEVAADWYRIHPQPHSFSYYLIENALHGFVFITPDFFIMGRPANKQLLEQGVRSVQFDAEPDCWLVVFACGELSKAWSILPYYLPWIAFERLRNGRLDLNVISLSRMRNVSEIITA